MISLTTKELAVLRLYAAGYSRTDTCIELKCSMSMLYGVENSVRIKLEQAGVADVKSIQVDSLLKAASAVGNTHVFVTTKEQEMPTVKKTVTQDVAYKLGAFFARIANVDQLTEAEIPNDGFTRRGLRDLIEEKLDLEVPNSALDNLVKSLNIPLCGAPNPEYVKKLEDALADSTAKLAELKRELDELKAARQNGRRPALT